MNYFELYDIPVSINVNQSLVKKKYYEMSKKYHPDFYITDSDEKQAEILELSTMNTNAYDTFKDEIKLIRYILTIYDKFEEGNNEKLPQEFLMEMMDMNEKLMELEFEPDENEIGAIQKELDSYREQLLRHITPFPKDLSAITDDMRDEELEKLKDYFLKRKYLLRIQERLDKFAAR